MQLTEQTATELLRQLHPTLPPRFIRPPKLDRGQKYAKGQGLSPARAAAEEARLIREIWKKRYGRRNRPRGLRPTAEEIAAARWGVDEEAVILAGKSLHKRR